MPGAIGIALEQWGQDKKGLQQQMLPTHTPPDGTRIQQSIVSVPMSQSGQQQEMSYNVYNAMVGRRS